MAAEQELSPPSKANLKAWWNHFTFAQRAKKDAEEHKGPQDSRVFGKPLRESLKYASVQISTANANGELYVWGYIPVVVAKCGLYLKENATEVEGTFRVNGSNKRMRELQAIFETPPRYGKNLDWKKEHYTTHDVASVFRRYLTQMPEPVIPHDMYHDFRDALAKKPLNQEEVIAKYKKLIQQMPRANQYLLLYVLDLLSVFARKSDKNLMTAQNLAVIFRPGLINHPDHELSPKEHQLSQDVLEFLIAHQDWFILDIPPPPDSASPGAPGSPASEEDIAVVPSSDDDQSYVGGGWRLVGKDKRLKVQRRRTTTERTDLVAKSPERGLAPVSESPTLGEGAGASVTRSRTLPSTRSRVSADSSSLPLTPPPEDDRGRSGKLKKQRRSSAVPGSSPRPGSLAPSEASGGGGGST
ncbi:Rho GTPase activation protein [Gloeophyllum trabeum ATCC 11539]|uniref:Rho GTPase activation protein n=1 Tax=Gloeophyllum trabeum (strain ATCC 11539 / FP-39264 / Madison 617) TaxID=670483 RepID=S7Q412_GLOTA|nr:Rho GTPase activation protein [Gloeophyllum trabeum ATCC 11539]EPQ54208.1 Rho GTPase activation protein [Gloeophyllum trabeum ATCC 11539]